MKPRFPKKIFKIAGWTLLLVLLVLAYVIHLFTSPKSDAQIREEFKDEKIQPFITHKQYKDSNVRMVHMQRTIDTLLPTLIFVHGSPGSSMDFRRYLKDSTLNELANIIAYDRIGYGPENTGEVLESLDEEVKLLHKVLEDMNLSKVVLIGYSYGGTLIMAADKNYRNKIALAPSVRGDLEPIFWLMNLTRWKLSRPFVPKVLLAASSEKYRHIEELPRFDDRWNKSVTKVLAIHGEKDRIVPFENSLYLEELFDEEKFSLIPIEKGNHSLIWTNFDLIKAEIIKSLKE